MRGQYRVGLDMQCSARDKPDSTAPCNIGKCLPQWYTSDWSEVRSKKFQSHWHFHTTNLSLLYNFNRAPNKGCLSFKNWISFFLIEFFSVELITVFGYLRNGSPAPRSQMPGLEPNAIARLSRRWSTAVEASLQRPNLQRRYARNSFFPPIDWCLQMVSPSGRNIQMDQLILILSFFFYVSSSRKWRQHARSSRHTSCCQCWEQSQWNRPTRAASAKEIDQNSKIQQDYRWSCNECHTNSCSWWGSHYRSQRTG